MKIKNKFILACVIIFILYLSGISIFTSQLSKHYVHIKYSLAENYYAKIDYQIMPYANYLMNHGFIVSTTEIKTFGQGDMVCHNTDDGIAVYQDGQMVFEAVINPQIVDDLILSIKLISTILLLITLIFLFIIYFILSKLIFKRLEILESKMNTDDPIQKDNFDDEISSLLNSYNNLRNTIDNNQKEKQDLIFAISHELKNPASKIKAIIEMAIEDVPPYNDTTNNYTLIENEANLLSKQLDSLLNIYKLDYIPDELINIDQIITDTFKNVAAIKGNTNINILINKQKLMFILNNLKSNIEKYTKENTEVIITMTDGNISIKNQICYDCTASNSTKVGNQINKILSTTLKISITNEIIDNHYITNISFNN